MPKSYLIFMGSSLSLTMAMNGWAADTSKTLYPLPDIQTLAPSVKLVNSTNSKPLAGLAMPAPTINVISMSRLADGTLTTTCVTEPNPNPRLGFGRNRTPEHHHQE